VPGIDVMRLAERSWLTSTPPTLRTGLACPLCQVTRLSWPCNHCHAGGQGKTSMTANLAGLLALAAEAANSPRRVLVVDCDPQGNLGLDFGYLKPEDVAGGAAPAGRLVGWSATTVPG
jgi:CobQ/CobB/MinD/ParA nucleotide binding domain